VSFFQALPYVSAAFAALALWRAAVDPEGVPGRVLRALALAALAAFAFGRGTAPSTLAAGLVLSTVAQVIPPKEGVQWRSGSDLASMIAAFAFAYLFYKDGPGLQSIHDPAHLALLVVAGIIAIALLLLGFRFALPRRGQPRVRGQAGGSDMEAAGLALMILAAATVRLDHWPAMVGAGLVVAAEVVAGMAQQPDTPPRRWAPAAYWVLAFSGLVAIAYPFIR
jgi:hypothetical protein